MVETCVRLLLSLVLLWSTLLQGCAFGKNPGLVRLDDPPALASSEQRIPNVVHFIFGLKSPQPELHLIHYMAIAAAYANLRPERLIVWYHYEPVGEWWELARQRFVTDVGHVRNVTHIFDRQVEHYAHKADILRLEVLQAWGGIYLDLDVFVLRDMSPLLNYSTVLGEEGEGKSTAAP